MGAGAGSAALGLWVAVVVVAVVDPPPPPPPPPGFFFSLIFSLTATTHSFVVCSLSEKMMKVRFAVETVK